MAIRYRGPGNEYRLVNNGDIERLSIKPDVDSFGDFLCNILKVIVLVIGISSIGVLVLLNIWQNYEQSRFDYKTKAIVIENKIEFSDMVNYAADFNGAKIVYEDEGPQKILMGFVRKADNGPEEILSGDNEKGNCWSFKGNSAEISIRVQKKIYPKHFVVKHANLASFDSAPRNFCVYRKDFKMELLGCYEFFLNKGKPNPEFSQVFACKENCNKPSDLFTLNFTSNHGSEYTCVYQFLIHGDPISLSY